jgi:hypothetical protein
MPILLQDLRFRIGGLAALTVVTSIVPTSRAVFPAPALYAQQADAKVAIMQADRDFNRSVASRDKKTFLSLMSETAVFVGDGPMRGHEEILKGWAPFFDVNGPTLTWKVVYDIGSTAPAPQ